MAQTERIYQVDRIKIENSGAFKVVDEDYGYSVRPGPQARRRATIVEWAAQYLAFLTIFATVGVVASSSGLSGANVGLPEVGIILVGLTSSLGFFFIGTRGTAEELQVDTRRHEYRTAIRNWRGQDRVQATHALGNVESAFVRMRGFPFKSAQFLVRTRTAPQGTVLLSGDAKSLKHLHEVLSRPVMDRQEQLGRVMSRPVKLSAMGPDGEMNLATAAKLAKTLVKPTVAD